MSGEIFRFKIVLHDILPQVWRVIEVGSDITKNIKYPRCIDGARACPPEDCGSSSGYYRLLDILSKPNHSEYERMKEWSGDYDPEYFDKKESTEGMHNPLDLSGEI